MTLRNDYVTAIEAENDTLREKIAVLEEMLGLRIEAPIVLGLTGQEAKIFGLLMKRELVTKQMALHGIYADRPGEEAEIKIVDVFVCKARKKIAPFGIRIETVWGQGYRLSAASKAAALALFDEGAAP